MISKFALFLSTALTAFSLALMYGVVARINTGAAAASTGATQIDQASATSQPLQTIQAALTPDEAAALAARAINQQDVYSVETATYQGLDSYLVVFTSGTTVNIGLDKQVLSIGKLAPTVSIVNPTPSALPMVVSSNVPVQPYWSREQEGHDN